MDLRILAQSRIAASLAVTALTSQTRRTVNAIGARPPAEIARDIANVLQHRPPDAIKIGMLGSGAIATTIARVLRRELPASIPVVLDPVLRASSGGHLASHNLLARLVKDLLPLCAVITPNIPEAEALFGHRIRNLSDMARAAREIHLLTGGSVLVKGGHFRSPKVVDVLWHPGGITVWSEDRICDAKGRNVDIRGTGCALSSALAAELARGRSVLGATKAARRIVARMIREKGSRRR
jgi:hydroxymethylpyrimidine kinase/phosphomethylpyrimidine kinase